MRILFLSNFYPPFARGGYEQWCQEVAVELVRRGHQVSVLTSHIDKIDGHINDYGVQVHRQLRLEVEQKLFNTVVKLLRNRTKLEEANLIYLRNLVADFQPDAVLIWGMWNVPRSVPALIEQLLPGRVAYYICDYWLSLPNAYIQRWEAPSRREYAYWAKQLIGIPFLSQLEKESPISLKLEHPICVSKAVQRLLIEAGVPINHARVIYGGTHTEEFEAIYPNGSQASSNGYLKLLYVGRLDVEKGVHTIIRAMGKLLTETDLAINLNIVGKGNQDYVAHLKALVQQYNLSQHVTFCGSVPRSEIPTMLVKHDALIFSSEWEEPFARTVLEAMAAGLTVIGTTTGGTGEILVEKKTGLTFSAGNASELAKQIRVLHDNPSLRLQLAENGRQCVIQKFTFQRMVDQIETALQNIACSHQA